METLEKCYCVLLTIFICLLFHMQVFLCVFFSLFSEKGICCDSLRRCSYCVFPLYHLFMWQRTTVSEREREITFFLRWIGITEAFFT